MNADEATWRRCFVATRQQVRSEWSDLAVEIFLVLTLAGSEFSGETGEGACDALTWFLGHRPDVLHEATRWAGLEMLSFDVSSDFLGQYTNARALATLRELKDRLGR